MNQQREASRATQPTQKGDCLSRESTILLTNLAFNAGIVGRAFALAEGVTLIARLDSSGANAVVDVTAQEGKFRGFIVDRESGEIVDVYLDNGLAMNLETLLRRIPAEAARRGANSINLAQATLPCLPTEWAREESRDGEIKPR